MCHRQHVNLPQVSRSGKGPKEKNKGHCVPVLFVLEEWHAVPTGRSDFVDRDEDDASRLW